MKLASKFLRDSPLSDESMDLMIFHNNHINFLSICDSSPVEIGKKISCEVEVV